MENIKQTSENLRDINVFKLTTKEINQVEKKKAEKFAETKRNMSILGIYKEQYDGIINIYVGMVCQYEAFQIAFEKSGYQVEEEYTNAKGAVNMRKVPMWAAMETLRKDIATYSDKLGLNPKALENISAEQAKRSKLEDVLEGL